MDSYFNVRTLTTTLLYFLKIFFYKNQKLVVCKLLFTLLWTQFLTKKEKKTSKLLPSGDDVLTNIFSHLDLFECHTRHAELQLLFKPPYPLVNSPGHPRKTPLSLSLFHWIMQHLTLVLFLIHPNLFLRELRTHSGCFLSRKRSTLSWTQKPFDFVISQPGGSVPVRVPNPVYYLVYINPCTFP